MQQDRASLFTTADNFQVRIGQSKPPASQSLEFDGRRSFHFLPGQLDDLPQSIFTVTHGHAFSEQRRVDARGRLLTQLGRGHQPGKAGRRLFCRRFFFDRIGLKLGIIVVLAARIVPGARELWNHEALFDYQDRFLQTTRNNGSPRWIVSWSRFPLEMWDRYRSQY